MNSTTAADATLEKPSDTSAKAITNGDTLNPLLEAITGIVPSVPIPEIALVKMQRWIQEEGKRVAVIFEGRDAAGKGGTIRRFTEHINPRSMRVIALPTPTEEEFGQWYFQRYIRHLPNRGEIVFFDRS